MGTGIDAQDQLLGFLFNDVGAAYAVPRFQRSYSWQHEQIDAFWEDLVFVVDSGEDYRHFLGVMVFADTKDESMVLDGQQRLSTLLLLWAALRDEARTLDGWAALPEKERIGFESAVDSLLRTNPRGKRRESRMRMRLNFSDHGVFEYLVMNGVAVEEALPLKGSADPPPLRALWPDDAPQRTTEAHAKMVSNYLRLRWHIRQRLAISGDPVSLQEQLDDAVFGQMAYVHMTVTDAVNEQMVFEALNARGLDLAEADLIKNYVYMQLSDKGAETDALRRGMTLWDEVVAVVGDGRSLNDFIKTQWNSAHSFTRTDALYDAVRTHLQHDRGLSLAYCQQLREDAAVYARLKDPSKEYWKDDDLVAALNDIKALGLRTVNVLLLALHKRYFPKDKKQFLRTVNLIRNFSVRYFLVGGNQANKLEDSYSEWAVAIREDRKRAEVHDAATLATKLKGLAPGAAEFRLRFAGLEISAANPAKVVLCGINNYRAAGAGGDPDYEMIANPNTRAIQVEHIVPQSPDEAWLLYLERHGLTWADAVNKVGNLTLLTRSSNKKASNRPFDVKRDRTYATANFPTTKELEALKQFGVSELKTRTSAMAKDAERIWRV